MESKQTCQCVSLQGESIFYRNMGIIEDWDASKYTTLHDFVEFTKTKLIYAPHILIVTMTDFAHLELFRLILSH